MTSVCKAALAASWAKKAESCNRQLHISDREAVGAQNFNFVPKFHPKMGGGGF